MPSQGLQSLSRVYLLWQGEEWEGVITGKEGGGHRQASKYKQ